MAKQIKVVKCPHCGNSKPLSIGNEHYRCDKCSTEFFLDNDDVNVNIRHSYEHTTKSDTSTGKAVISITAILTVLFFVVMAFRLCSTPPKKTNNVTTPKTPTARVEKEYSQRNLFQVGNKLIAFYFESQNSMLSGKDSKGFYAVFYDVIDKKVIKKEQISNNHNSKIEHRYFSSTNKNYYILDDQTILKLNAEDYMLQNMTKEVAQSKPALNSGFSTIYFVPEKNGDGFRLTTNLGKEFYYFPNRDQLYTDRAFKHMIDGGMDTAEKDAELRSYYLFQNKESKQSSNVAQLLKITYKYNHGGPENKLLEATTQSLKYQPRHRITAVDAITDDRICFSPEVLYSDSTHILVSFRPTLADNAAINIQLLTTVGDVLWTVSYNELFICEYAIKIDSTYFLQTDKEKHLQYGKRNVLEIKKDGQKGATYTF